jgi:plasmid maintenance system antidote protein VapI
MLVGELLDRLRDRLRQVIRNGQLTERGLARRSGLSQAHVHNMLKGVRAMTPAAADRILRCLGWTVGDLLDDGADRSQPRATSR